MRCFQGPPGIAGPRGPMVCLFLIVNTVFVCVCVGEGGRGGGEGQCTEKKRIPNFFLLFLLFTGQFTSLQTLK